MIWMSCAASHGPSQPLQAEQQHVDQARDHRRDGERQVDQRDQQALAAGTRTWRSPRPPPGRRRGSPARRSPAASSVSRIAASAAGSRKLREVGADALAQRLGEHRRQRQDQEQRRGTPAPARSAASAASAARATPARLRRDGRRAAALPCSGPSRMCRRPAHHCSRLIASSIDERRRPASPPRWPWPRRSRTARACVMISSGAISVFIGMLPEMKTTEPYSPSARAKASAKPVSSAGSDGRQDHAAERLPARWRPGWRRPPPTSASRSSSAGCSVRTTNGRPMNVSAMTTPSGENAALMPSGSSARPIQPFGA